MNFDVRLASDADAKLVADISHQTFFDAFAAQNTKKNMDKFLNQQFTKGRLMEEVGAPDNIFLLAYYNNEVAGYAKLRETIMPMSPVVIPALEVARLYAMSHMVGKGVGSQLMQTTVDIAKQKNIPVIWLAVWKKNDRAIDFYTRWGFEKFNETLFVLGDDIQHDWLMRKAVM